MVNGVLDSALTGYVHDLEVELQGELSAVYAVGAIVLDDFSARQSNVDLVVVTDDALSGSAGPTERSKRIAAAERRLLHAGRSPSIWYTTWGQLACEPPGDTPLSSGDRIDTPMTRSLLREDAIALTGPDWPVVWFDEAALKRWCRGRFASLVSSDKGLLIFRRVVSPMVLEAARLAHGALTGRVLSKSAASEAVRSVLPSHFRRILTDSAGYRQGAHTSMYWGPYERKYDALRVLQRLGEALGEA